MREFFTLDPALIYLSSASQSICPDRVLNAVEEYRRSYELNPARALALSWSRLWKVQEKLAHFFGASPRDLFIRSSATQVMSEIILGVDLPSGSEILTTDFEYAAIKNACFYRSQRDGHGLRSISIPSTPQEIQSLTADTLFELVVSSISPKTRLIVLSHVLTANGLVFPVKRISAETRRRGVLLMVDGAHAAGSIELDFGLLENVDFYAANLHKWMLGPKAASFCWVPARNHDLVRPASVGLGAYNPPQFLGPFASDSFSSRFLMTGVYDFSPFFGIEDLLNFWAEHGVDRIRSELRERFGSLKNRTDRELSWDSFSPTSPELQGPILTFQLPPSLSHRGSELCDWLYREQGVQVAAPSVQGRGLLRLSPHVYNTDEEISRAIAALKKAERFS